MSSIKNKITKQELEELVDSEGGMISGDRNVTNNSEIETGPVEKPWNDNSDYEKGMATTTDRATRYRQNIPWFAVYSYRSASFRSISVNETSKKKVVTKKQLEEEIKEDLVKKSKRDGEVLDKAFDTKVEKMVDTIEDTDLSKDQLEKIKKAILNKIKEKDA
jgi:hypothetical protein